jgi:hypothetical protein
VPTPGELPDQQLQALLRHASNQLEILDRLDMPHHADEAERRRISGLSAEERGVLRLEALNTIYDVRTEFRRRSPR